MKGKPERRIIFTADARLTMAKAASPTPEKVATLSGYAILWNVLSTDRGGYTVRLRPGSAKFEAPTLALWHHDPSRPIGNTANGTLRLFPDDIGVRVEIDLPDTTTGRDAEELVENKYVTGMSFAMTDVPDAEEVSENGQVILNVKGFTCDEVTVTATPAFTQTNIQVAEDDEPEDEPSYAARSAQSLRLEKLRFDFLTLP